MATTQIGTQYYTQIQTGHDEVSWGSVTGLVVEEIDHVAIAAEGEHLDSAGETDTHLVDNPGSERSFTAAVKSTGGTLAAPAAGTIVTINSVKHIALAGARVLQTVGEGDAAITKVSMTVRRRDSLAAAIDA